MTTAELICTAIMAIGMPRAEYACKHMNAVVKYSAEYNVDPVLLTSLIYAESRWNPKVESRAGACGLTQIIPKWSRKFGYVGCNQLKNNPTLAIHKGAQILSFWINGYGKGRTKIGLCAYNAGYRCRGSRSIRNKKGDTKYTKRVLMMHAKIRLEIIAHHKRNNSLK